MNARELAEAMAKLLEQFGRLELYVVVEVRRPPPPNGDTLPVRRGD